MTNIKENIGTIKQLSVTSIKQPGRQIHCILKNNYQINHFVDIIHLIQCSSPNTYELFNQLY